MTSLRKKDLLLQLSMSAPEHDIADIDQAIDIVFSVISNGLASGKTIKIRKFGSFHISHQKGRSFLNPKTGAVSTYPSLKRIVFTPSPELVLKEQDDGPVGDSKS